MKKYINKIANRLVQVKVRENRNQITPENRG